jgi:hypothetical protein
MLVLMAAQDDSEERATALMAGALNGAIAEKVAVTYLVTTSVTVIVCSLAEAVVTAPLAPVMVL